MDPNQSPVASSILNQDSADRQMKKPHVTWDEEQLAAHDKTRGNKMKIDEPKTPYVTEEEFEKLCADDPDYQKEFGKQVEVGSQDAQMDDQSSNNVEQDLQLAQANMKFNMNIAQANSDDEMQTSP